MNNGIDQETGKALIDAIHRLADTLERVQGKAQPLVVEDGFAAYVFEAEHHGLRPVSHVAAPHLTLLKGIDRVKATLLENSRRFAAGLSANNALLWGARGMGKSTLIKAVQGALAAEMGAEAPALIEIHREDIAALPALLGALRGLDRRFIVYCDDLSFNNPDTDFKALKSVLEGGLEGRPDNVVFYATSNRRHLLPRTMMEQESATGIHPNESMDETIALSDRFGLWLGFHPSDQTDYLAMVEGYLKEFGLDDVDWRADALEWAKTRGNRSGRTAWQFVADIAGRHGRKVGF
ncbi:ATP-binding protein [Kordiimonas marina]|uniref:ATP-binding protein n=1 Tax=Kordiimonas marina TaxID=2872312 RepID=UPI003CCFED73